ncbi:MAG TPA: rhodanese-like domain-containing protein [Candidatus Methylomirabilis sp.]|nr:rhodanese-like domain-containing protein [Candidatus Methylomirabilis sp.]
MAWALLALGAAACATTSAPSPPSAMTPDALLAAIYSGAAPVIVDVRTGWEYNRGHVPGAINIPFYTLLVNQDAIPRPPDRPVVVYCEHGPRAGVAKLALRMNGFTDVRYLDGHMSGWKERGLPIEMSTASP